MADSPKQFPRSVWLGMGLAFGLLGLVYLVGLAQMEQARKPSLPVIGQIADFTLTNQDGHVTSLADLTNHVWIADIVFTRCAGPCPRMTAQMKSLQDLLTTTSRVRLVTLTTDPDFDTPAVMRKYGEHYKANFNRWTFLTGAKKEIASLASGSLKLSSVPVRLDERKDPVDLFIHSTYFVLVDQHAQLRAVFETGGEGVDWTKDVQPKLLASLHQLEREQ